MAYLKAELSEKSKYWISRHRYYELKHFCLQYPEWRRLYADLEFKMEEKFGDGISSSNVSDPTAKLGQMRADLKRAMELVERCATDADPILGKYVLKGVTQGIPFVRMQTMEEIPCGKDLYYDCYRRFFWLLSRRKGL